VWNIGTFDIEWQLQINVQHLTSDPFSNYFAVLASNDNDNEYNTCKLHFSKTNIHVVKPCLLVSAIALCWDKNRLFPFGEINFAT